MTHARNGRTATAQAIAALIRIYRAAVASRDVTLAKSTSVSLERYGIKVGDLTVDSPRSEHIEKCPSQSGGAA